MNINKIFNNYKILFLAIVVLILANYFNSKSPKPFFQISKQESSINFNEKLLYRFNFGLKRLMSATLWISTIQESDIDHYKRKDLNSWMFLRFNSISILDPNFYENYLFGGTYLSIVKDDIPGASIIYKKGLALFPDDYELLKSAGFHFYFEANDQTSAYPIYKKLQKLAPKNPQFSTVLSRMIAAEGNLQDAFDILTELQNSHEQHSLVGEKIFNFRYAIKAEIDLSCLNSKQKGCQNIDLDGNPYIKNEKEFVAVKKWKPYRPKKKLSISTDEH
jgi:tetratricopeptide (TPR) repeat protein